MPVIGYTTGVFDLFHIGHLNILRQARTECSTLIVGVTTDELCEARKNKKPVIPFEERCEIMASIRYVDQVVPQDTMDKIAAWKAHRFDTMFVGDDWKGTKEWRELEVEFAKKGVKVRYFPYTSHTSSTILRKTLEEIEGGF